MTKGKRHGDGTKRRHFKPKTGDRKAPATAPRPVAPGYERKDSGHIKGATDSIAEFIIETFSRLGDLALTEIDEQQSGEAERRPFHCHGNASVSFGASYLFEVKGVHSEDADFQAWLEDIRATEGALTETTLAGLPLTFGERIGVLAVDGEKVIMTQLETEMLYPFTVGCFVRVTDADLLIHFRLEQRPPRAFAEHTPNDPATS